MKKVNFPHSLEILESIQDGVVVVDKNLRYLYANKSIENLIGIPPENLIGKKFTDTFPHHNLNIIKLLKIVKNTLIHKKTSIMEIYFKPLDRWFYLSIYPLDDKFSIIFKDITQEKQIKKELQYSKEQLDIIFKNVSDGIVIQDKTGKIIYINDAVLSLSGAFKKEYLLTEPAFPIAKKFDIFDLHKKPLSWDNAPGRQVLFGRKKTAQAVLWFIDKETKDELWLNIRSARISSNGKDIHAISILHNITELKQIEQQKDNFLSLVSHELKTPLTILKVYEQMLQKQIHVENNPHIHDIVKKIESNTEKLVELIHSLLDVSRIQEGKMQLNKHEFSLYTLLQDVVDDLQPITKHPIVLKKGKDITITADRERISQVIINFITNAMKYSINRQKIVVSYESKKKEVIVSVKDLGLGISHKDQQEIFRRFYQSPENNTFTGLGLGLYISAEIIREHGGTIGVKSIEKKGSTFYFTLPTK